MTNMNHVAGGSGSSGTTVCNATRLFPCVVMLPAGSIVYLFKPLIELIVVDIPFPFIVEANNYARIEISGEKKAH